MLLVILVMLSVVFVLSILQLYGRDKKTTKLAEDFVRFGANLDRLENSVRDEFQRNRKEINEITKLNRDELSKSILNFENKLTNSLESVRDTIDMQLKSIREDNSKQLEKMRETVDEKLQTTLDRRLGESFKQVSERLEQVHKGLGEMQTIASDVGSLKQVLSNVKSKGIIGEIQLENILQQILSPEQYVKNAATKGSRNFVEFAIKLPGNSANDEVLLPIDSKFPTTNYESLMDAFERADKDAIETAQQSLRRDILNFAKDISEKYIDPPNTTDFAVMFLPVEGLYAEVLRIRGLFEEVQRLKVTIAGPTTLAALLNSLRMGFRTLAVQKRSSEVWKILKEVKTEFAKFSEYVEKAQKKVDEASKTLSELKGRRTNVMQRKLNNLETIKPLDKE